MKQIFKTLITLLLVLAGLGLAQSMTDGFVERPDGARIYYEVHGEGEPMMLIHGYPLNSGLFRDNVGALAEAGYMVITPDLRGFGRSEAPSDEASIEMYAEDMLAVMDELGVQEAIVGGMSMGGITLFQMYNMAPERFKGLIFNDTVHLPASVIGANLWMGAAEQAEQEGVGSLVSFLMSDMLSGDTRMNNMDLVNYYGSLIEAASVNGAVGGGKALANRPDATPVLAEITVPTLVLFGLEDSLTPFEVAQGIADGIVNSRLELIEGAAHGSVIEAADRANEIILDWAQSLE